MTGPCPLCSPSPHLAHFGKQVLWKVHGAGSPESRAQVQLCPPHSLGQCFSSLPGLCSGIRGRWGEVCPSPTCSATLTSVILRGCQPDPILRTALDNSRRAVRGVRAGQCETYLSCSLRVPLDQGGNEGHAALRDGPVEEIPGQGG